MSLDYLYKYKYKIQSAKEIYKKLKKIKSKVILCHGNFDVVHPGHLRHLANAKLKADILVVSITKDKYIKMLKQRYISCLVNLTKDQIKKGINEIKSNYSNRILFNDILICIKYKCS